MITAWILYSIVVGSLLGAGGFALERLFRIHGLPSRWIWAGAILLSVGWPVGHWAWEQRPYEPPPMAADPIPEAVLSSPGATVLPFEPMSVEVPSQSVVRLLDGPIIMLWALSTFLLLIFFGLLLLRTRHFRTGWQSGKVGGQPVLFSDEWGPAVVGFVRPQIVLPGWCKEIDDWALRFIIDHELEHVKAGDLRLIILAGVLPVLLPWHLPIWWQLSRLRTAVEGDCDLRVLGRNPGQTKPYVDLLLDVGHRTHGKRPIAAMLSEPYQTLKRRIRIMTMPFPRRTWIRGGMLAGTGIVLVGLACWAPGPTDALNQGPQLPVGALAFEGAEGVQEQTALPYFTPYTVRPAVKNPEEVVAALQQAYPSSLKEAGVGGTVTIWFFVDEEGTVQRVLVNESSRHRELDDAAIRAANIIEFTPALNRDQRRPVWISVPFLFTTDAGYEAPFEEGVSRGEGPVRGQTSDPSGRTTSSSGEMGLVAGTTRDVSTGAPISSVQLYVAGTGRGTLSNQDGRFVITHVPVGEQEVVADLIGYGRGQVIVSVNADETAEVRFDLRATAIAFTPLVVRGVGGEGQVASGDSLAVQGLEVRPSGIEDRVNIVGTAVDLSTRNPVGAVDVRIEALDRGTITNTDGQFVLGDIPPGDHALTRNRTGYEGTTARVVFAAGEVPGVERSTLLPGGEPLPPFPLEDLAGVVVGLVTEEGTAAPVETGAPHPVRAFSGYSLLFAEGESGPATTVTDTPSHI